APGGGTRRANGIQKDFPSEEKKVSTNVIREKQILALQDENATLQDKIKWLEDELEEARDDISRLEHGLPVEWREP
ncbi:MAG: hypothetical protein WC487_05840, partial [Candidatus Omnitrophota bacterium]